MRSEHCQTEIRQDIHLFILVDILNAPRLIINDSLYDSLYYSLYDSLVTVYLFILVDNINAPRLVSAVREAEVSVHGSANYNVIQSISINIADSHAVSEVGPDLVAGQVVELLHGGAREEDDLAGQVGATGHPHLQDIVLLHRI